LPATIVFLVYLSIYLGLPRELPVSQCSIATIYIPGTYGATAHARSHPYCKEHSSFLFLSLALSHPPCIQDTPHRPALRTADIAIEEDLPSPVPRRYYEYKIFRSAPHVDADTPLARRDDNWYLWSLQSWDM